MIDVIIPVYRGLPQTRRCVESVLASRVDAPHEVIVIDDASPEPALREWLREVAASGRITLRAHTENRGFVATANEGMQLHADRDVVLLNSDTEVADGWLDRLAACAARKPQTGTVTPFSNNATICSYPLYPEGGPMPPGTSVRELSAAFAAANAGQSVELPTGVGFCLFIRRECLEDVGAFDEEAFGAGYGEEVDLCLRATRSGWKHWLAADAFVYHEGSVSFGVEAADQRRPVAQRTIDARYPGFPAALADFFQRDPARPARRQVSLARLRDSTRPKLLFLAHGWGGGVSRHVDDLVTLIGDAAHVLALRPGAPGGPDGVRLSLVNGDDRWEAFFRVPEQWAGLVSLLRGIGIARVHLHHTHGLPASVLGLPAALNAPLDVTLHDYLTLCPQHNLADVRGRYCGEPDEAGCNRCLAERPHPWGSDIAGWRRQWRTLLGTASRIWAPSRDLQNRVSRYHPAVTIDVLAHPEAPIEPPVPPVRVLVLGGLAPIKGLETVSACAADSAARQLPLFFRVLGHLGSAVPCWPEAPLSVTGSYPEGRLTELIAAERGDVVLFASQVPESFSYTLSEALASRLPIVAFRHGAFVERLEGVANATLVPPSTPAASINAALLAAAGKAANA